MVKLLLSVFLYGGVSKANNAAIDTSLESIRLMNNDIFPENPMINVDKFRQFIAAIRFHNLSFNLASSSNPNDDDNEFNWVSDIAIVCDRSTVPVTLALIQYAGQEREMTGDRNGMEPIFLYLIDITSGWMPVFFTRQPTHQPLFIDNERQIAASRNTLGNSPERNTFKKLVSIVMNVLLPRIEEN
ncbi:unnamed protein product [Adineta ricciae]|uniref:Uncharacterized protein n=1 Tax=Adineta ricciae TaxID=249248 RepID=A0A814ZUZ2_ADIRI|nr:unnamed protein product [Adineta ricciae]CAF1548882.1 unnamed protein product [Adineta ricciae]